MIRVLLRQPPSLLGTALARVLASESGIVMVGRIGCDDDLVLESRRCGPDVVVVDGCREPDKVESECFELHRAVPEACVLVVLCAKTPKFRPDLTRLAPRVGFVTTDESYERFAEAIRRLAAGGPVIVPEVALAALKARDNPLTAREREVLGLVLTGASTKEIAAVLYLRVGTVRNYLSSAIAKVGARTRVDAVRIAQEEGWI